MSASAAEIAHSTGASNLADVLEMVLDKGVVIAGDIRVELLQIELLTIRIRLLIASVDKARAIGIDWWSESPFLRARAAAAPLEPGAHAAELQELRARLERLERAP